MCSQVCVMCVYAWGAPTCPCACFYRQRVATAALPLSSVISNQLSRLKPKVVYGRRRFLLSFSFSLFYSFPPVLSSSPAILLHYFILFFHPSHSPRSFPPLYLSYFPQTKPCPPLTLCLLSVNSFFLFPVCWPRLTYFSISLSISVSAVALPSLLLSHWFLSHLPLLSPGNKKKCLHMCPHKHTHTHILYMHVQRETQTHKHFPPTKHAHIHTRPHKEAHTDAHKQGFSCHCDEVIPRVQSDRSL